MNKTIYVVRHGQTDVNKQSLIQGRTINASLDETGREQADRLKSWMIANTRLDHIFCSSLVRTKQTAQPLADHFNIEMSYHPELDELNYGELEGKSCLDDNTMFNELRNRWADGEYDLPAPGGESPKEVLQRADAKARELIESAEGKSIMFMLHGRLIRIILAHWLGLGLKKMHQVNHANAAVNMLEYKNGTFESVRLHIIEHLDSETISS